MKGSGRDGLRQRSNKIYQRYKALRSVICGGSIVVVLLLVAAGYCKGVTGSLLKGELLFQQGHLEQALESLLKAQEETPGDARVLSGLGRTRFHLQQYQEARENLLRSLAIADRADWVTCWSNVYLGKIDILQGEAAEALNRLSMVLQRPQPTGCALEAKKNKAFAGVIQYSRQVLNLQHVSNCCTLHYATTAETTDGVDVSSLAIQVQSYSEQIIRILDLDERRIPQVDIFLHPDIQAREVWQSQEIIARYRPNEFHVTYNNIGYVLHELVHFYTADKVAVHKASPALIEGLAEYVVGQPWGVPLHTWVMVFGRRGDRAPLSELLDSRSFRRMNPIIAYAEAGSFVEFIISAYGLESIFKSLGEECSISEVTGKSIAELEEQWLKVVTRQEVSTAEAELVGIRLQLGTGSDATIAGEGWGGRR
ncbi:MAG: hypothetical protein GY702_03250 [Desulfobulbaceae bacterium]|nr:hypothetical protein [Desulfobulbaceae bacterium]